MAPEEIQDLVQDFTAKATAVNAVVQELPNMAAALQYVVDVCENKAPCELMADEDVEKGPNGPNGVPTRVQRIVAAPVLNDEDFATLEAACKEKGFLCIREGLRNHLAGIDVGLTSAEMGALQPEVAQEPAMALEAGEDGLVFYRAIAEHYQKALRPGGALALEIGWQQREAVTALLAANGWTDIVCRKDFGGNDRCVMARKQ